MRKLILFLLVAAAMLPLSAQTYQNPVIPGMYPDPSVCRVGDDFYLVNSSFCYFPGVPLFHSKDLIHWEQKGYVLDRDSQLPLDSCGQWSGIYAPTIRYNDGTFYMITTNVGQKGKKQGLNAEHSSDNFLVYTRDIDKGWSEPVWLEQGGIDPSLYFEGGRCYMVSNPNGICLCEIDPMTGKTLSPTRTIWRGTGGRCPEGPHIYKKDGWYYLLISEGGTELNHHVTIARSRDIYGPYEANPANPILYHFDNEKQGLPIQGTGHADIVDAPDGSWWMVCLAFRPQGGWNHLLGRETCLAPVRWDTNAWPVVNGNGSVLVDNFCTTLPQTEVKEMPALTLFNGKSLPMEWNYMRNPNRSLFKFTGKALRIKANTEGLEGIGKPSLVCRRVQHIDFTATASLSLNNASENDEAGLSLFQTDRGHYDIVLRQDRDGSQSVLLRFRVGRINHIEKTVSKIHAQKVWMRVEGSMYNYNFSYSVDGKNFIYLGAMDPSFISTESVGGFTGLMFCLYAKANTATSNATADFNSFDYTHK